MLRVSTSLMVVCTGFMSSFAQAEDYVTQSQVNVANGVAGLNASKQVTADIMASSIYGSTLRGNMMNINKPSSDTAIYPVCFIQVHQILIMVGLIYSII